MSNAKKPSGAGKPGAKRPHAAKKPSPEPSPEARRKQLFLGLAVGAVVGVGISLLTEFWLWLPAGLAFGLAVGVIMKPPAK